MMRIEAMPVAELNDADLVAESLKGDREAFRQIVERYQTLVASVAYCATGNTSLSEDLAQETFVTAWKQLAELREPAKLRPWLCGIARFLISKEFRRLDREPSHGAEPLETADADEWTAPEPLPPDHAISDEEKALLWRALERVPDIYREPLVLFYREHQSIESVAHDLDLSEDAVKQRLSRGRKLLQEQFLGFVAGALKQTAPGKAFTLGVLAALPLVATTAKAATAGTAAAKGSAMAKATGLGAIVQTTLKAISSALAFLSPILLLGGYFGFKMGGDARRSAVQRESVTNFWRIVVGSLAAFVALPLLLLVLLALTHANVSVFHGKLLPGLTLWLGAMYVVLPAALVLWAWQRRRKFPPAAAENPAMPEAKKKTRLVLWVLIAMVGAAGLLTFGYLDSNHNVRHMTTQQVQKMITDGTAREAEFRVLQYQNGYSYLWITFPENGKKVMAMANADDATLALLKAQDIKCPTSVQGRDFEIFGWPGRLLPVLCIFILAIGAVVLLRRPGKFAPEDPGQIQKLQQTDQLANKVFGTGVSVLLLAAALLLGAMTRWHVHHLSSEAARQFITQHTNATYVLCQYTDGSREILLTQKASRALPYYAEYRAPVDDATMAALKQPGVTYRTLVQGRDFGYADPTPWISSLVITLLLAGAGFVLQRAWRKKRGGGHPCLP